MPSLTYQPQRRDLLDAYRQHDLGVILSRRMLLLAVVYAVFVGGVAFAILSLSYGPLIAGLGGSAIGVSFTAFLLGLRHTWLPRFVVWRQLKERHWHREQHLTWSDQGYAVRVDTGASDVTWGHYVRWREDARTILLYFSSNSYQFVPKRFLPPGAADFIRAQLRTAGVPEVRGVRLRKLPEA